MTAAIETTYESGKVVRYHANPRFNTLNQTTADHQWGVAAIIISLHPSPPPYLVIKALFHDAGELFAGDLSYPFKRANPEIATAHAETEHRLASEAGIPGFDIELTDEEQKWLFLADRLESHLFAKLNRPEVAAGWAWKDQGNLIRNLAEELGCLNQVKEIFNV